MCITVERLSHEFIEDGETMNLTFDTLLSPKSIDVFKTNLNTI